jgi:tetratricopeptide (TPR) repeat protein
MTGLPENIDQIFWSALQLESDAERQAYIERACGGDAEQRRLVEKLLRAQPKAAGFLEQPLAPAPVTVAEPISEGPGTVIGSYKLLEQIGEGGFGVVFMAEQTEPVRRKVALKILKPGMDIRQVVARFEAERQALAIMDHPNIAKVLDGGQTTSGRPYFVMDLVKGLPITDYCDQAQLTPRERLELFVNLCQAVQHAHQKGVIHRDLKPSNVLVMMHDSMPVVKVIDFGVAKALGQELTDKTLFTGFAQMIGTPLYMSPEQAGHSGVDIDTRSDIYSLGVMLYELLTGTTPFEKDRLKELSYDELRRVIREEEPPKPSTRISTLGKAATTVSTQRKSDPKRLSQLVRGELDWIVMKCLEKDRNRRYETASALAADVQRYLADEPVQACPPSTWYRSRKFARRHKTGLAVAGLILFFLALSGMGVGWAVRDHAARRAKAANDLEQLVERAEFLQTQGKRAEAEAALEQVHLLVTQASPEPATAEQLAKLRERLAADARDEEFLTSFHHIRFSVETQVDLKNSRFTGDVMSELSGALRRYGIAVGVTAPAQVAAHLQRPEPIRRELLAALYECFRWLPASDAQARQWLFDVLGVADNDAWRVGVREAFARQDWKALEQLVKAVDVQEQPPAILLYLAASFPRQMRATRLKLLRRIQAAYPADLWANHGLAMELWWINGKPAEAIRYFNPALALDPKNPGIYLNRGAAFKDAGEVDAAIADLRQAVALAPSYAVGHNVLGVALAAKGRLDEAIAAHRKAIKLKKDYSGGHYNLGIVLLAKGRLEEAVAAYREAIKLEKDDPMAYFALGRALGDMGRLDEAIAAHRNAIARKDFAGPESRFTNAKRAVPNVVEAQARNSLGAVLTQKGLLDEALVEFREAARLDKDDAAPHFNMGKVRYLKGQLDEAITEYREAIRLKKDDALPHYGLGIALDDKGRLEEAIAAYREAIRLKKDFAEAHHNLGIALRKTGQVDEAIAECREAIRLKKDDALAHNSLGAALYAKAQLEEAIAQFREAIRLKKEFAEAHYNLGNALYNTGRVDEAIAECREAIRLRKNYPDAHGMLGIALSHKGRLDDAIAEFREAIRLKKDSALAHNGLGNALSDKGRLEEAIAEYREALRLNKNDALAHNNLGFALEKQGCLDEAIAEYREAIRLKKGDIETHVKLHYNLARALRRTGKPKEAAAEFREVVRLAKDKHNAESHNRDALGRMDRLACAYRALGQKAEAAKVWESLLPKQKAQLGPNHPDTVRAAWGLSGAYSDLGRYTEGVKLLEEMVPIVKAQASDHEMTGDFMNRLAICYQQTGRLFEAAKLHKETLAFRKAKLGPTHSDTLGSTVNLAMTYMKLGREKEALKLLEATLPVMRAKMPDHGYTRICAEQLARCCYKLGRIAEAVKVARQEADRLEKRSEPYDPACYRALIAGWLRSGDKSETATKEAAAEADRAMALLHKAVAAGFRDVALLKRDNDLDALRGRKDFKKLIADLEAKK